MGKNDRESTAGNETDLDPQTRSALLLNVVDGYTQTEIAEMLSVPVGTVSSWIWRGRARVREVLTPRPGT